MADVEWLIAGGLVALGLILGLGIGLFISRKTGKVRDLQDQLQGTQSELNEYREQVVTQFSETARKFKTLNDAYGDLHQQLAESANALCGNAAGPLLEAPAGAEKLISAETADESSTQPSAKSSTEPSTESSTESLAHGDGGPPEPTAETKAGEPSATKTLATGDAERGNDILVSEPDRADRPENDAAAPEPSEPRKFSANP